MGYDNKTFATALVNLAVKGYLDIVEEPAETFALLFKGDAGGQALQLGASARADLPGVGGNQQQGLDELLEIGAHPGPKQARPTNERPAQGDDPVRLDLGRSQDATDREGLLGTDVPDPTRVAKREEMMDLGAR